MDSRERLQWLIDYWEAERKRRQRRDDILFVLLVAAIVAFMLWLGCWGCVSPGAADFGELATLIERVDANVSAVHGDVAALKTGDIGGDGDSVVSWLLAAGLVVVTVASGPIGSWWYERVRRPQRLAKEVLATRTCKPTLQVADLPTANEFCRRQEAERGWRPDPPGPMVHPPGVTSSIDAPRGKL